MNALNPLKKLFGKGGDPEFPHAERVLAADLGLAHDVLRSVRSSHLAEGSDWKQVDGIVRYSEEGRLRALDSLKITDHPPVAPAVAAPASVEKAPEATPAEQPVQPGEIRELVCHKQWKLNTRIFEAKFGSAIVRVRIRDNRNLLPGMKVKCRFVERDMWEMAQRLPPLERQVVKTPWTQDDTERWLTENPLPPDLEWQGKQVLPSYRLHKGYGFWLRTTPYHRGLFARCHDLLEGRGGLYDNAQDLADDLAKKPLHSNHETLPGLDLF